MDFEGVIVVREKLKYLDYSIFIPFIVLTLLGIIMVYSASSDILLVNGFKPATYAIKQAIYAFIAIFFVGLPCFAIKLTFFQSRRFVISFLFVTWAMLGYLVVQKLLRGNAAAVNGAVGWINLKFINIQPLEIAKLALVVYLAFVLGRRFDRIRPGYIWENLSGPTVIAFITVAMVIVEPDFGGAAILLMIVSVMFAVSGIPAQTVLKTIVVLITLIALLIVGILVWNPKFIQNSYQFQRFLAFMHPFKLQRTSGAQLVNSYYAIHNGGLFGLGLGNSIQKRGYLPEPYTDFILSITAEELGTIGAIVMLTLLFYLMYRIMEVGVHAFSQYDALVCFGVATILFTETLFNVGAVLGLLPITGVTLPFISYGGSSIIVLTSAIGLVLNVSAKEKKLKLESEMIV